MTSKAIIGMKDLSIVVLVCLSFHSVVNAQYYMFDVLRTNKNGSDEIRYLVCNNELLTLSNQLVLKQDSTGKIIANSLVDGEVFEYPWPPHPLEHISSYNTWKSEGKSSYKATYQKLKGYSYLATVNEKVKADRVNYKGLLNLLFHPNGVFDKLTMYTPFDTIYFEYTVTEHDECQIESSLLNFDTQINTNSNVEGLIAEFSKNIIPESERVKVEDLEILNIKNELRVIPEKLSGYYLLDFWASWCKPCIREFEFIPDLIEKYGQHVSFISISLDESDKLDVWKATSRRNNISWDNFILQNGFESSFAKIWNLKTIPRYMILDKDLKVVNNNAPKPSSLDLIILLDKLVQM